MDPHPDRGTPDQLTQKAFYRDSSQSLNPSGFPFNTVAMSPEADKEYLGRIASESGGMHFRCSRRSNPSQILSDLYISLKRPQTVELEKGGFEIDSSIQEGDILYREERSTQEVSLISPLNDKIRCLEFPPGSDGTGATYSTS